MPQASPGPITERLHRGVLLVAGRELTDPNFSHSVVLVTHLDDSGTVGLILNRPLPMPAAKALPPLAGVEPDAGGLFLGGPVAVETLQLLLRTKENLGAEARLVGDVYLVEGAKILKELVEGRVRATDLRLFAGYAGWAPGQLEAEMLRGDWILYPADAETVFAPAPERLWPELVDRASERWVWRFAPGADVRPVAQYNPGFAERRGLRASPRAGFHPIAAVSLLPETGIRRLRAGRLLTCSTSFSPSLSNSRLATRS